MNPRQAGVKGSALMKALSVQVWDKLDFFQRSKVSLLCRTLDDLLSPRFKCYKLQKLKSLSHGLSFLTPSSGPSQSLLVETPQSPRFVYVPFHFTSVVRKYEVSTSSLLPWL